MFFKKIKLYFLIVNAFLFKEKKVIFASLIAGIVLFFAIGKLLPYIPRPKSVAKIGLVGNFTFEELPASIINLTSSGLTKIAADGSPLSSLATWKVSADGKIYTFSLAQNIFWQDGTEVTSDQINYNFPAVTSQVLDKKTIQFSLKEPFAPFPNLLSTPIFKENFVGTGKYQIKRVLKKGDFVKQLFLVGPDKNIIFNFYPNQEVSFQAFKLNEIDTLSDVAVNFITVQWNPYVTVSEQINKDQYIGIFLNLRDKTLGDKNLRQALAYATPKPTDETRALGPLSPNSWAYNPDVKAYKADATTAKKLFEKFLEDAKIDKLSLQLNTTSNLLLEADQIKKSWQDILAIDTEIRIIDNINNDFQVLLITSQIPPDPDQYSFWHSTQNTNLTGYKSPKVDKILEDARKLEIKDERLEKYLDFQKFLLEDCPVIFLSHPATYEIKRRKISI